MMSDMLGTSELFEITNGVVQAIVILVVNYVPFGKCPMSLLPGSYRKQFPDIWFSNFNPVARISRSHALGDGPDWQLIPCLLSGFKLRAWAKPLPWADLVFLRVGIPW